MSENFEYSKPSENGNTGINFANHLAEFLETMQMSYRLFRNLNTLYTLEQIRNTFKVTRENVISLLCATPGFEPIYKFKTTKIVGFKLTNKQEAIKSLRTKIGLRNK